MERMLMNATQPEEMRVALLRDQSLIDLDIEYPTDTKKKANIYKARITRIEPSLEAVFVDYGARRQGFLPFKEIAKEYFQKSTTSGEKANLKDLLTSGQELMVQVDKDERGNKGAALTTFITLAGCYLVLMPNSPTSGGISRRIEGEERDELRETLNQLNLPKHMGVIVRTAGVGKSAEDLQWDLDFLCNQWQAIQTAYDEQQPAPFLIHREGDVIVRSIRDNLRKTVNEIIIDDFDTFNKAKRYIDSVRPNFSNCLKFYQSNTPLFTQFGIESQIEFAYQREVLLPSGGSIVIDRTEALVSIDINSAKATSGADIETTALHTNLEAADEIARQLRIRDLGGLIVIDFIDMGPNKHQRDVETRLREAFRDDRARVQIGRISRFGLLEMSRQRLRLSLSEMTVQQPCDQCHGRGIVRPIQAQALMILRLIDEHAFKNPTTQLQVQLPVKIATYLINEKRKLLTDIETRHRVEIIILPLPHLVEPHYHIECVRLDHQAAATTTPSYQLLETPQVELPPKDKTIAPIEEPAIKHVHHQLTSESQILRQQTSWWKKLWKKLTGDGPKKDRTSHKPRQHSRQTTTSNSSDNRRPRRRPSSQQQRQDGGRKSSSSGRRRQSGGHHHHRRRSSSSGGGSGSRDGNRGHTAGRSTSTKPKASAE
ncbi:MAG: Rne/Rng family ribonuclease [Legionellales bacterium]|nr:Rne/Rng family ribonuclease [Legionellales bacterium]